MERGKNPVEDIHRAYLLFLLSDHFRFLEQKCRNYQRNFAKYPRNLDPFSLSIPEESASIRILIGIFLCAIDFLKSYIVN